MTNQQLIEKHLSKDLWEVAWTYTMGNEFLEKIADLIEMILRSRSIDTHEEKQNWFNLLPLMNDEQVEKLRNILLKEKRKLKEIEAKYSKKKQEIKKKYMHKRQKEWYTKKISNIREEEAVSDKKEDAEAEALLENM